MLTIQVDHPQLAAHLVMLNVSVGRDPKNLTTAATEENLTLCLNGRNLTVCLHGPVSTLNRLFFKILKFSGPSLPGMTSSTLQPYFLSGVYYDNGTIYQPLRSGRIWHKVNF